MACAPACYSPAVSIGKDHRVELSVYAGPLDLLLWLVKEEEVDVHDIPIARILERYLEVLQTIVALDLDQAGEFLVMASLLLEIKSRSLLPREDPLEDEELDPRFELVQKLLEYRRLKEASEALAARQEAWEKRFPPGRTPEPPGVPPDEAPIAGVSVWDLAQAFQRLMDELGVDHVREIVYDDVPIEVHIENLLGRLDRERKVEFVSLFPRDADRRRIAGIFIALLELVKQRKVRAVQAAPFAPIEIERREEEEEPPAPPPPAAE